MGLRDKVGPLPGAAFLSGDQEGSDRVFADRQGAIDNNCERVRFREPSVREFEDFPGSRQH